MAKYIPLSQGKKAIVDDQIYDEIAKQNWCFNNGRAVRNSKDGKLIYMARHICNAQKKDRVKFRNGDTLDCRLENLILHSKTLIDIDVPENEQSTVAATI
jgi:endonuclease YncB( thermonuclease family)